MAVAQVVVCMTPNLTPTDPEYPVYEWVNV